MSVLCAHVWQVAFFYISVTVKVRAACFLEIHFKVRMCLGCVPPVRLWSTLKAFWITRPINPLIHVQSVQPGVQSVTGISVECWLQTAVCGVEVWRSDRSNIHGEPLQLCSVTLPPALTENSQLLHRKRSLVRKANIKHLNTCLVLLCAAEYAFSVQRTVMLSHFWILKTSNTEPDLSGLSTQTKCARHPTTGTEVCGVTFIYLFSFLWIQNSCCQMLTPLCTQKLHLLYT